MKIPKLCLALILFSFSAFSLSAQTAAEMDTLLEAETVSIAASARFILGAVELLPLELSSREAEEAAYDMAKEKGWVRKDAGEKTTLKDTAFLVMNAFQFKGGVMYSIFPNPRYAYREMVYRKIIQGRSDPGMTVSGLRLLQIIGAALSHSGEAELLSMGDVK